MNNVLGLLLGVLCTGCLSLQYITPGATDGGTDAAADATATDGPPGMGMCPGGQIRCATGVCLDLFADDPMNCGTCGNRCMPGEICAPAPPPNNLTAPHQCIRCGTEGLPCCQGNCVGTLRCMAGLCVR